MKNIYLILVLLLSISSVSAVTIYSGESIEIELEKSYEYYSIVGNETEVILSIIQNGNNVTITPDKYSQEDSYEVIFFDAEERVITVYQSSGGGGGTRTIYKDKNVTEYVDRDVIEYRDREVEVEVPGETIENEVVVNKIPFWIYIVFVICLIVFIYFIFRRRDKTERGLRENEENIIVPSDRDTNIDNS